jgi:deazaflavin-dependent oxidoreductase (nitroreductase family)
MSTATGIPPFDPAAQRGPFYRGLGFVLRTRAGRWLAMNVSAKVDPWLLAHTSGRVGTGLVLPTANLATTGARSGARRTAAVLYFTEGDEVILIASNFGQDHHPAWYHNLISHPEAELERGGVSARYVAHVVSDPADHDRLFQAACSVYPGYNDYQRETAAIGRRIPILKLTPAAR